MLNLKIKTTTLMCLSSAKQHQFAVHKDEGQETTTGPPCTCNKTRVDIYNIDIVKYCQYCFGFEMPSELWAKRISKLNEKIANCSNSFVARFSQV